MRWEEEEEEEEQPRSIPGHCGSYTVLGVRAGAEHGSANQAAPPGDVQEHPLGVLAEENWPWGDFSKGEGE